MKRLARCSGAWCAKLLFSGELNWSSAQCAMEPGGEVPHCNVTSILHGLSSSFSTLVERNEVPNPHALYCVTIILSHIPLVMFERKCNWFNLEGFCTIEMGWKIWSYLTYAIILCLSGIILMLNVLNFLSTPFIQAGQLNCNAWQWMNTFIDLVLTWHWHNYYNFINIFKFLILINRVFAYIKDIAEM